MKARLSSFASQYARHWLNCSGYDHNWLKTYYYDDNYTPLLPKGTILHAVSWIDNTAKNANLVNTRNAQTWGQSSVANMVMIFPPQLLHHLINFLPVHYCRRYCQP